MPLFQNEANAVAAWISGQGFAPRVVETELHETDDGLEIHFDVELAPRAGRNPAKEQYKYEGFLETSPAEDPFEDPWIRPVDLAYELGLDVPDGSRECDWEGCPEAGKTYFVPTARLYGIDRLYCAEHAPEAEENFSEDNAEIVPMG
jgi:hypothetical protein